MEAEKYVATDCRVAARVMRYGNHFPSVQDTLIEAADRIEALEAALAKADDLADAFYSAGNVTDRHTRALHALVAYREARSK